jgi:hypothetical protein
MVLLALRGRKLIVALAAKLRVLSSHGAHHPWMPIAMRWEYRKVDLNDAPREEDDLDLLARVGAEGWELVTILTNNVAYLRRPVDLRTPPRPRRRD